MDGGDCPDCGEHFLDRGQHLSMSDCSYPEITKRQRQIVTGLLMSDGWISRDAGKPRMSVAMTNKDFLEWLDGELGFHSTGVRLKSKKKGLYELSTRRTPQFEEYTEWYEEGGKKWKVDKLTPLVVKMLYVGDGNKNYKNRKNPYLRIGSVNEQGDENVLKLFNDIGFEPTWNGHNLIFGTEESKELCRYMGSPPPGFKYKWIKDI